MGRDAAIRLEAREQVAVFLRQRQPLAARGTAVRQQAFGIELLETGWLVMQARGGDTLRQRPLL